MSKKAGNWQERKEFRFINDVFGFIGKGKGKDGGDELAAEKEQVLRSKVESLIQKLGSDLEELRVLFASIFLLAYE